MDWLPLLGTSLYFMDLFPFYGLVSVSWTCFCFMDWFPFYGLVSVSWIVFYLWTSFCFMDRFPRVSLALWNWLNDSLVQGHQNVLRLHPVG